MCPPRQRKGNGQRASKDMLITVLFGSIDYSTIFFITKLLHLNMPEYILFSLQIVWNTLFYFWSQSPLILTQNYNVIFKFSVKYISFVYRLISPNICIKSWVTLTTFSISDAVRCKQRVNLFKLWRFTLKTFLSSNWQVLSYSINHL